MKSCDNDVIRRVMAVLGSGFDCASKQEIQKLLDIGVKPSRIIFAHPVKFRTHIKFAASVGIHLMTFDCVEELLKIQECDPNARLVLRIRPPLESTLYNLGEKFGCYPKEACRLVQKALDLNMVVEGISFHVGFSFQDSICFVEAIKTARWLFDEVSKIGVKMSLLDIGGGYPSSRSSLNCFRQIAASIRETLDECFPPSSGVRVIAEPGQYMVAAAFNLYCKVILVKHQQDSEAGNLSSTNNTYITDGKYGCFGGNFYPHQDVQVLPLVKSRRTKLNVTKLWGPTCDSEDIIFKQLHLEEVKEGEWIYFDNMGAYSIPLFTSFNGFSPPIIKYIMSSDIRHQMEQKSKSEMFTKAVKFLECYKYLSTKLLNLK
ncbi:ornithine decarboxylase-like isoform X2 [Tachypleus tridentatus]